VDTYFRIYDSYTFGAHDYADPNAGSWNQLCPAGAAKMSARLGSIIHGVTSIP
jgi:hypothetical protein